LLILAVEDDPKIRGNILLYLRDAGFSATAVGTAEEALSFLESAGRSEPDLLLLDVRLPGLSGVEMIKTLKEQGRLPPTVVVSGEASITETVEALQQGVYDFIEKPFTRERLLRSIRNAIEHERLRREVDLLRSSRRSGNRLLGRSAPMEALRLVISRVAATRSRVLIRGESGTGKELVAEAIHQSSSRRDGPFLKINCAAIPSNLIENELFGHARGAFTDAHTAMPGLFERADGGTILLDEIGDMELSLQSRLLRVLEDGRVTRLGETVDRKIDVRILAATHQDLEQMIRQGAFREDLYFRLAAVPLDVPPLRERKGDVALLASWFLDRFCRENQRPQLELSLDAIKVMEAYPWPGNVRELRNVCERLSVFGTNPITASQLPLALHRTVGPSAAPALGPLTTIVALREFRASCERDYIEQVLRRCDWNFTRAARLLDLQRSYLHQKASQYGIERPPRP
jgi:two-component system, NtrC family, nitrogen regulation response regulator NtrX